MTTHSDPDTDRERPPTSSGSGRPAPGDVDLVFELLSHRHRRAALRRLERVDDPISLDALAADLAAAIDTRSEDERAPSRIDRVRVALYHTHLPILVDADVIEYDHDRDRIERVEPDPAVSRLLDASLDVASDA